MKTGLKYNHFAKSGMSYSLVFAGILLMNLMMTDPSREIKRRGFQKENFRETPAATAKNIVIVHGAFADGSGFKEVYRILTKRGFNVTIVQNPLTSLKDDVDATLRALDKQDGPTILVGHSWGGNGYHGGGHAS